MVNGKRIIAAPRLRVSAFPVSMALFAEFIRTGCYFDKRYWDVQSRRRGHGGDEILRRIGYQWDLGDQPVRGVTWFEASAFCKYKAGRLPWAKEVREARRLHAGGPFEIPEWCGDWYNPFAEGPEAKPDNDSNARRRVEGWDFAAALPSLTEGAFGFRIVFE